MTKGSTVRNIYVKRLWRCIPPPSTQRCSVQTDLFWQPFLKVGT